jgi:hypothetical protein
MVLDVVPSAGGAMSPKGVFDMFMEGWAEGLKPKRMPANRMKPSKPVKPETNYQWIRVARYIGEDTSLEPKKYRGFWRWLLKRIKQS